MGNQPSMQLPPPENLKTEWNMKHVYKLIELRRLAPFFPYIPDEEATIEAEECPICLNFLVGGLNRGKCCSKGVCTACFITIKKTPNTPFSCPFCLVPNFEVAFLGPKTQEQIETELEDQRKVEALKRLIREEEIEADRQRELKRQQEREKQAGSPIPEPPQSPPSPTATGNTNLYGSPKLPSSILELYKNAKTQEESDMAELEAAIWLSLHPDEEGGRS